MTRVTAIMVGFAALTLAGAFWMAPEDVPVATFEDTGTPLFPDFSDPSLATSLEVSAWDKDSARVSRFKVELKEGKWLIPSHNDYPADGAKKMGQAAASFIDVQKDIYYGDKTEDHASYQVVDPTSTDGAEDGRGTRFTLQESGGSMLVDIIVGKEIPDKRGFRYVRFPEQKRVYGARLELDISTEFTDWIEKDLLHMEPKDVVKLVYDPYRVDEARAQVVDNNPMHFERENGDADWTLIPTTSKTLTGKVVKSEVPAGKELDEWKIDSMLRSIDSLEIVGVRPRPDVLTLGALQSKGFFVTQGGPPPVRLFGNEGEVKTITEDGIVYTLYFGEVTFESGLALTAGADPNKAASGDDKDKDAANAANRYLFVDARYEPERDRTVPAEQPEIEAKPGETKPGETKPGEAKPGEAKPGEAKPGEPKVDPRQAQRDRAKKLQARFGKWFYVISDKSFKDIHKDRNDLFKDKKPDTP